MAFSRPVAPGSIVRANGQIYTVVSRASDGSLLCRPQGSAAIESLTYRQLVSAPDFRVSERDSPALDASLDALTPELRANAEVRIGELLEARTGYRGGNAILALPGEPRPEYDPASTSLTERMKTKAAALGISAGVLYEWWSRYETHGAAAVLDGRSTRQSDPLARLDGSVREAILAIHRDRLTKPRISNKLLRLEVEAHLKANPETAHIPVPPQRSFDRYYQLLRAGDASKGPTKYQRSRASGPQGPYGTLDATYCGQYVLIDETPTNVWVVDPITLEPVQPTLVLAVDGYSRSILAGRFVIGRPNQVDAAALLRDIVSPKPLLPDWPEEARWHYAGVPESVVIEATQTEATAVAASPIVSPETVITDNGWIYKSRAFRDSALLLGINVLYARAFTPTDKAAVESTFGTINENFFALQRGYKGRDVASGADGRVEAQLFLDELEQAFWKWVVTFWQPREHEGLCFGAAPRLGLSPDDVYEESLARVGFMSLPLSRDIYFHLLPRHFAAITREGIEFRTLTYDCDRGNDLLAPFRNRRSPYPQFGGKWPIRYDDRDLQEIYLQDPKSSEWLTIPWRGAHLLNQPFGSDTRDIAIALAKERGRHVPHQEAITDALREIIERREKLAPERGKELAAAKRARARADQVERDRPRPPAQAKQRDSQHQANGNGNGNGRSSGNGKGPLLPLSEIRRLETVSDVESDAPSRNGG